MNNESIDVKAKILFNTIIVINEYLKHTQTKISFINRDNKNSVWYWKLDNYLYFTGNKSTN